MPRRPRRIKTVWIPARSALAICTTRQTLKPSTRAVRLTAGGSIAGQFASNAASTLLAGVGSKGHAEGTTQAAIAEGSVTIRDKANQEQDVTNLSRDTENANDSISPIFDKEKEQNRLKAVGLISDIAGQAADVVRSQGELTGRKAAKDPTSLEEARQQLAAEGKAVTDAAVQERAYNNALSFYGTGGAVQRGIQAATGALTVLAGGGDLAGALAAASAPELANIIGHRSGLSDNDALIAHALLGGVVASLQGKSAAAGAAGALTGEVAARAIKDQLFPGKDNSDLNEADKQLISNLATLASGLAGNIVSGNASGTTAGAQAGKNAVENNALSGKDKKLPILDIRPGWLKPGVLDEDGDLNLAAGGIAKGGKSKDTKIWTETKKDKSVPNDYGHWEKHKEEFPEYQNAKQYVDATHSFVTTPPQGTQTKTRTNGDTLYYNPATNTFASKDVNGVPRTMFKPEKGLEYWNKQ